MCTGPVHNNSHLNVFYIVTLTGRNKRTGKERRKEEEREMTTTRETKHKEQINVMTHGTKRLFH